MLAPLLCYAAEYTFDLGPRPETNWSGDLIPLEERERCGAAPVVPGCATDARAGACRRRSPSVAAPRCTTDMWHRFMPCLPHTPPHPPTPCSRPAEFVVCGLRKRNVGAFFNHSCACLRHTGWDRSAVSPLRRSLTQPHVRLMHDPHLDPCRVAPRASVLQAPQIASCSPS